jgi:hypothetical protein
MVALAPFQTDTERYPTTEGAFALSNRPHSEDHWQGPYLPTSVPSTRGIRHTLTPDLGRHGDKPDVVSYGAAGSPDGTGSNADAADWLRDGAKRRPNKR